MALTLHHQDCGLAASLKAQQYLGTRQKGTGPTSTRSMYSVSLFRRRSAVVYTRHHSNYVNDSVL